MPDRSWSILLQPWSYWGQRWDPSPEPDPDRFQNCGPECLAMCIMFWSGVEIQAAYIHDVIHGTSYIGGTTVEDMRDFLKNHGGTKGADLLTVSNDSAGRSALFRAIWYSLVRGCPVIGLRSFSAPYTQPLHFGVIVGMTPNSLIEADPWTGEPRTWSYDDYWNWSWNVLVLTNRSRAIHDHAAA